MKNLNEMSIPPILQLILVIGSITLAYMGIDGWGWFLFIFVLTCIGVDSNN